MRLYFLRHGQAEQVPGKNDFDRVLTEKGIQRTETAAKVFATAGIRVAHIFSSPRVRARQTAEIVAAALEMPIEIREEVNYEFNVHYVEKLIATVPDNQDVMFVGHEPTLSNIIGKLTGAHVEMKTTGLARIDLISRSPLAGVLVWLVAPRFFDAMNGMLGDD